jgi:hypothetical protein
MIEPHDAIGGVAYGRIVGDHDDGVAFGMEITQQGHDPLLVVLVEIAGRLVGEDDLGLIDQGAGNTDALLLAARELSGQMVKPMAKADPIEGVTGLTLVDNAMEILCQHDVLERCEVGDEVELLEDQTDGITSKAGKIAAAQGRNVGAIDDQAATGGAIEATHDVEQRRLP